MSSAPWPARLTPELMRQTEPILRDRKHCPFVSDVICSLPVGYSAFYASFPKERIRELRV